MKNRRKNKPSGALSNSLSRIIVFVLASTMIATVNTSAADDVRAYQHGINFIPRPDNHYLMIWASSGNPPQGADNTGSWTHDIYYSLIDPDNPKINPLKIISRDEAQEPASAAVTNNGHIMISMEDGWNTDRNVAQRYGVYDINMQAIKAYPQLVQDGGHSGHVSAAGNRFVVFYSDEWVHGGGVDNLGSGDDVIAKIYSSTGQLEKTLDVAVGKQSRDWWPLAAGSENRAMLVWQRFEDGETWSNLMLAVIDPATGGFIQKPVQVAKKLQYYTYSVAHLPSLNRFLITATSNQGTGFALLYDENGKQLARKNGLPAIMRESQLLTRVNNGTVIVAQAIQPSGISVLTISDNTIELSEQINASMRWSIAGTDGLFIDDNHLYMVGLSSSGLIEQRFEIKPPESWLKKLLPNLF
jgi:hypothetical protein